MSFTTAVTPHVPHLRRFARALTGSNASGDAYAMAAIEALAMGPPAPGRLDLFGTFLTIWSSIPVNAGEFGARSNPAMRAADKILERLSPLTRVVFLLRTLEGFDTSEIAEILGRTEGEIRDLQSIANREIVWGMQMESIVVEDMSASADGP